MAVFVWFQGTAQAGVKWKRPIGIISVDTSPTGYKVTTVPPILGIMMVMIKTGEVQTRLK